MKKRTQHYRKENEEDDVNVPRTASELNREARRAKSANVFSLLQMISSNDFLREISRDADSVRDVEQKKHEKEGTRGNREIAKRGSTRTVVRRRERKERGVEERNVTFIGEMYERSQRDSKVSGV